jgi:hypothetical protein
MNSPSTDATPSPYEEHERHSKIWGGYTAFVAALLVATMAISPDLPRAWIVVSLLALSLPSLVAYMLLDFKVRVMQKRKGSMYRGLAALLGIVPSLVGTTMVIGHFSVIAAVLFVLLTIFWLLLIDVVTYLGFRSEHSRL